MTITPEQFAQMSLEQARSGVDRGEFTPADLLEASFARMDAFEPAVNAVITRSDDAARARAASVKPGPALPLAGAPVALKDCIMTRGLRSTCGSRHLDNFIPPYSAAVVDRLLAAGAVVNAKTNMDEFAMGASGENSAYGPTRNPWNPARVPGGSSSGSAAIVAYGGALAALGSDTGGSVRQPAGFCGLAGMKPTYGRVSRNGVAALASSLDQIGPLTRTVRDNALLMDILSGHDPLDSTSAVQADEAAPCLPGIENGVKGLRIGFDPSLFDREGLSPVMAGAMKRAVDICRDGGAEIREVAIPLIDYGVAAYYIINCCEASTNMTKFDGIRYGVRASGSDLWDVYGETRKQFGDEVKRRIMMGSYALSKGYYDAYYLKATRVRRLFTRELTALFAGVDAVLLPVAPQPPRNLGAETGVLENYLGDIFTLPANLTGVPSLAFPVGVFEGLPAGVQAMGAPFREDILYRIGRAAENNTRLPGAPWTKAAPEVAK
ncbi:MAG: Asp-tRNA(Asn)/Glu-tRNA(Gln) amidotransferase subunit GatA [Planctomycetota bacterium]|jgi:aspartyl-tRNA(Asn)/glutamyl-tRNA(Gln) amidotransferase subunit A|nr:Asp-tRNA(Asn)/Glu-tRNA(Gln) amidotransferase subunit GatA [Planctomycetota bacterium]